MDRRNFLGGAGLGAALLVGGGTPVGAQQGRRVPAQARAGGGLKPLKIKLGGQASTPDQFELLARFGVKDCFSLIRPTDASRQYNTVEELERVMNEAAKYGITVNHVDFPFSPGRGVSGPNDVDGIMQGKSPQREREMEWAYEQLRNVAKVGIPMVKHNMGTGPAVVRTGMRPGRGASQYSAYRLADADPSKPLAPEPNTIDQWWERVTWFQERIVPMAEEFKVRLGVHPQDPGRPPNFGGVNEGLGSFEGMKRYIEIKPSPYIGFNFCQGTMTENLEDPNNQIHEVIRYFGSRNKIFNVHFRNIRGKRNDFAEVFHDEGDINMGRCVATYREVGYDQMLVPDHTPRVPGKPNASNEGFVFAYGYIRGLLQQEANKG